MKPLRPSSLLSILALLTLGVAAPASAAIVVTLPTATVAGSFVITQDITFTITTAGSVQAFVFDEWVTSDGDISQSFGFHFNPGTLSYSVNAGSPTEAAIYALVDNNAVTSSDVTANDGFIFFNPLPPSVVNDIFTVKAATYTIAAGSLSSGFNPQAQQTFTGNAFLLNNVATRLSANTPVGGAVPEPGSLGLLALGALAAATRRRRRAAGV